MEPFTLTLIATFALLAVGVAIAMWDCVREWCVASLLPWVDRNLSWLSPSVRNAYAAIDNAMVSVRRTVRHAWEKLRAYLLHQTIELRRSTSSQWIIRVTSWVIRTLESGERVPVRIVTEEQRHWDTLPSDVRAEWLKQGIDHRAAVVTKLRDQEVATAY